MATLALAWRVLCALTTHKPAHGHGHGHGGKVGGGELGIARTKAQGRLLLFWVGCVCPMGVLYGHMGTIQPPNHQNARLPTWVISRLIQFTMAVVVVVYLSACCVCPMGVLQPQTQSGQPPDRPLPLLISRVIWGLVLGYCTALGIWAANWAFFSLA
jgi:hypothetical protein